MMKRRKTCASLLFFALLSGAYIPSAHAGGTDAERPAGDGPSVLSVFKPGEINGLGFWRAVSQIPGIHQLQPITIGAVATLAGTALAHIQHPYKEVELRYHRTQSTLGVAVESQVEQIPLTPADLSAEYFGNIPRSKRHLLATLADYAPRLGYEHKVDPLIGDYYAAMFDHSLAVTKDLNEFPELKPGLYRYSSLEAIYNNGIDLDRLLVRVARGNYDTTYEMMGRGFYDTEAISRGRSQPRLQAYASMALSASPELAPFDQLSDQLVRGGLGLDYLYRLRLLHKAFGNSGSEEHLFDTDIESRLDASEIAGLIRNMLEVSVPSSHLGRRRAVDTIVHVAQKIGADAASEVMGNLAKSPIWSHDGFQWMGNIPLAESLPYLVLVLGSDRVHEIAKIIYKVPDDWLRTTLSKQYSDLAGHH